MTKFIKPFKVTPAFKFDLITTVTYTNDRIVNCQLKGAQEELSMLKKQLIMDKALELFAQQGFKATSVQQITDHCGISKGAFYLSFHSKDELIFSIIDRFMMQHITKLDHLVTSAKSEHQTTNLLYDFYYTSYEIISENRDFAKFFMKEFQTLHEDLIEKLSYYDTLQEKIILKLIEQVYGSEIEHLKYDLLYCVKSFIGMYVELILFKNIQLDIHSISNSLVEKTNILANSMKHPFIQSEHFHYLNTEENNTITKEKLMILLDEKMGQTNDTLIKDSLLYLRKNLQEENLPSAIVKGLIENIRKDKNLEWIAYLLLQYYQY